MIHIYHFFNIIVSKPCQIFDKYLPFVQYYCAKTLSNLCQIFNKNLIQELTKYHSGRMIYFRENSINPYPADQNFRLLRLLPNSTKVLFHTFIHTLPTVTKLYATISSCTACQMYQKSHKIYYIFFHSFLRNFRSKIVDLSVNKI